MIPPSVFSSRRLVNPIYIILISIFIVLTLRGLWLGSRAVNWSISGHEDVTGTNPPTDPPTESSSPGPLELPDDYKHLHDQSSMCDQRLGLAYLQEFRRTRAAYCTTEPPSRLTCFHGQTDNKRRTDSFCIGQGARYDEPSKSFQVSCNPGKPWGVETNEPSIPLEKFERYWYNTGPRNVMDMCVDLSSKDLELAPPKGPENFTILLKREGASNPWHCLMEIMSLSMSLDVLQMSPDEGRGGRAFWAPEDADNTRVVILDDDVDGPYFDLWQLFAKQPTVRLAELPAGADVGSIILPLAGASNPVWQGDWEPNSCGHSELLRTFSRRVLGHYDITDSTGGADEGEDKVIVTFIERRGSRKLIDMEKHMAALENRYSHAKIQVVDLEAMPFSQQVQVVRGSDVLAGVHGAGLTHALWLKERSAVVEILPGGFEHKGFRNFAGALGHDYFSTHSTQKPKESGGWQHEDVALEEDRFLELMDVAVKSMYNKGRHNFDLNKRAS